MCVCVCGGGGLKFLRWRYLIAGKTEDARVQFDSLSGPKFSTHRSWYSVFIKTEDTPTVRDRL